MKGKKKLFKVVALKLLSLLKAYAKFQVFNGYHILIFIALIVGYTGILIGLTFGNSPHIPLPSFHANVQIEP